MLNKIIKYPKTIHSFLDWYNSKSIYRKIYEELGRPRANDVSLRDGLQGLSKQEQKEYNILKKMTVYNEILEKHSPKTIESGSIVSRTLFPVFEDTVEIYKWIEKEQDKKKQQEQQKIKGLDLKYYKKIDNYVFIPSYAKFCEAIKHNCFDNFSFVTSASEEFLLKNVKQDFNTNYEELRKIRNLLHELLESFLENKEIYKTKLYVSCINQCPIEGKLDNMKIVDTLVKLNNLNFHKICLSDTCGTLEPDDFSFIVDKCNEQGLSYSNFGLHLHVKPERENKVEEIIHRALDRKIVDFDVSILETGGCSVTMNKEDLAPNLSYELYYKSLVNYIVKKSSE